MKFYAAITPIDAVKTETLVVFVGSGKKNGIVYSKEVVALDAKLSGKIRAYLQSEQFKPVVGATFVIHTKGILLCDRIIVVGYGDIDAITSHAWQSAVASGVVRAKKSKTKTLCFAVPEEMCARFSSKLCGRLTTEAAILGTYAFLKYKKEKDEIDPISVTMRIGDKRILSTFAQGMNNGVCRAEGTMVARDLVNEPSSVMTPSVIAKEAKKLSKSAKIHCTVFGKKEIKKLNMHAFLAVSKGSDEEPKFIKLVYRGGGDKTICLVGKGITYDSGGLSLKPAASMETMKCDMAGAAAILGVFETIKKTKPKITVIGLIAACENMPSGHATKPGDVVRAMNGTTIEIVNTDAEGRLILADALSYAEKYVKCDYTIDIATLTGACVIALGEDVAGVFANTDGFARAITDAALVAGEKVWRLPLERGYEEDLKSPIADIQNVSKSRYGGAINGALFLQQFVNNDHMWAHLDIAGPAFAEKETSLTRYGGTGFSVRTLLSFIEGQVKLEKQK